MKKGHKVRARKRLQELSEDSQQLFRELCDEYNIRDLGGQETLRSGLRAKDQPEAAEARILTEGTMLVDRFGQPKSHPLLAVARDFRAMWAASLRSLNFAIGDPPKVGRPEGGGN
jgi:hypothetical protein